MGSKFVQYSPAGDTSSSHQSGFTLIELLVVLAIVSIIVLLAAPNYEQTMVESRLDQERLSVATGLAFARSEAIERATDVRICRNTTGACGNQITTTFEWNRGWRLIDETSNELLRVVTKKDTNVDIRYDCGDYLSYGATGERSSGGSGECTFTFRDADNVSFSKALVISPTGRVRMN